MKTIIYVILFMILLYANAFAATATVTNVQVKSSGVVMHFSVDDTGNAGIFDTFVDITNDMLLQYPTWTALRDTYIMPQLQVALSEKRTIVNRTSYLTSKVNQTFTIQ